MAEEPKKTEDKPAEKAAPRAEKPSGGAAAPVGKVDVAAAPRPEEPRRFDGFLAEIVEVMPDKTGMFGSVTQVMAKILEGRDKGRVIRKNVTGRIKVGDQIRLADTSREDKPINVK